MLAASSSIPSRCGKPDSVAGLLCLRILGQGSDLSDCMLGIAGLKIGSWLSEGSFHIAELQLRSIEILGKVYLVQIVVQMALKICSNMDSPCDIPCMD